MSIRALDLFCGAGGSSWGARAAGVEIVAAFDIWPLAGAAHDANFPEVEFIPGRLEELNVDALVKRLGEIQLIVASPECTNHSPAKGNKPRCEQSKETAFQVVRFAAAFTPRWIVIENVVNMRKWNRYTEFKSELEALGYKLREQVLNSAHFGVPQSRKRLFLLADKQSAPPKISPGKCKPKKISDFLEINDRYKYTPLFRRNRARATLERARRGFPSAPLPRRCSRKGKAPCMPFFVGQAASRGRYGIPPTLVRYGFFGALLPHTNTSERELSCNFLTLPTTSRTWMVWIKSFGVEMMRPAGLRKSNTSSGSVELKWRG